MMSCNDDEDAKQLQELVSNPSQSSFSPQSRLNRAAVTRHAPCVHLRLVPGQWSLVKMVNSLFFNLLTIPRALWAFLHYSAFSVPTRHREQGKRSRPRDPSDFWGEIVGAGKIVGDGEIVGEKVGELEMGPGTTEHLLARTILDNWAPGSWPRNTKIQIHMYTTIKIHKNKYTK